MFTKIILICCKKINGERGLSSIYHLLNGKKSIQTVQDAHNYNLTQFYGILPSLDKNYYDQTLHNFIQNHYLKSEKKHFYHITQKGNIWLHENEYLSLNGLNGIHYHQIDQVFFNRLLLFVQMITNNKMNNNTYIPIVDQPAITKWAKDTFRKISNIEDTVENLHKELSTLLTRLSETEASLLVDRLTGYQNYGLSINQLANKYNFQQINVQLILIQIIHKLIKIIIKEGKTYPILDFILDFNQEDKFITNSAYKTYKLLINNHSVSEIARLRQLKENTVYDHLVEIALYNSQFPFERFIDHNTYKEINQIINKNQTYKLKEIKLLVRPEITYFQIRLALAMRTVGRGSITS